VSFSSARTMKRFPSLRADSLPRTDPWNCRKLANWAVSRSRRWDSFLAGNHSVRPDQLVLALLATFVGDDLWPFVATRLVPCLGPGVRIRTVMKCGCAFAQASAFCLVSKNRSMTMALHSAGCRPDRRAALRVTTAYPVSTAEHVASGKTTLLP
jgi:hypothetical protein